MFKKSLEAKSFQRLSGADRKKLRRTAKGRFPNASDADIDSILPPKAELTVTKFPNRVCVYGIEGGFPMLFDVDGRGNEIFPTVYALWNVPELLPTFVLKGGEVSRFIIAGADLMFPGISIPPEGLPSFVAGQPWAVKVPGNPAPIAVGITMLSSSETLKAEFRGKALRITHYYRDSLWESAEGHYVPNGGFFEDVVIEDPAIGSVSQISDASEDGPNDMHDGVSNEKEEVDGALEEAHLGGGIDGPMQVIKDEISEEMAAGISGVNVSDNVSTEESNGQQSLSTEEVDILLDKCLLQALHTTVKDKDLPMPGSTLWSGHILPCRPPGITLDIKRSSHKKLSKWLQAKASSGLISAKEDKYKKEIMLLGVKRIHPEYTTYRPEKRSTETVVQKQDSSVGEAQAKQQLELVEIYKPSTHVNLIFTSVGVDTGKYFSAAEATDIVFRYVEKENLVKPTNKAMVILDAILCDALYKGAIKKGTSYPTEIHKKDLGVTFLNRMQVHHKISRGNEVVVRKGAIRPIQIMTERRQGNKKMTRVSGLESFLMDAESLASELQKKFACSTTTAELPGKKGQHEVLVQGGVIDDLSRHLIDQYSIPKRYIEILDKTRK